MFLKAINIFIFSLTLHAGHKWSLPFFKQPDLERLFAIPRATAINFGNQHFQAVPNTGEGNDCFFLALQQAGLGLTREGATDILLQLLEVPEARLIIAQDLAADWRDGRFVPTVINANDLPRDIDFAEYAENVDELMIDYITNFIGGPNMFALTPGRHGLIDLLAHVLQTQIRVLTQNTRTFETNMVHDTGRTATTNARPVHLLLTNNHFEFLRGAQDPVFEPILIRRSGHVTVCTLAPSLELTLFQFGRPNPVLSYGALSGILEEGKNSASHGTMITINKPSVIRNGSDFFRIFEDILELVSLPRLQPAFLLLLQENLGVKKTNKTPDFKSLLLQASENAQNKKSIGLYNKPQGISQREISILSASISSLYLIYPVFEAYHHSYSSLNYMPPEDRQSALNPDSLLVIRHSLSDIRDQITIILTKTASIFQQYLEQRLDMDSFSKQFFDLQSHHSDAILILAFLDARPSGPLNAHELAALTKLLKSAKFADFKETSDIFDFYVREWSSSLRVAQPAPSKNCIIEPPSCQEEITVKEKVKTRKEPGQGFDVGFRNFVVEAQEQIERAKAYPLNKASREVLLELIQNNPVLETAAKNLLQQIGLDIGSGGSSSGSMRAVVYTGTQRRSGGFEVGHGGYLDGYVKNPTQLLKAICVAAQHDDKLAALLEQLEINWEAFFKTN